jgi:hypothetical protein
MPQPETDWDALLVERAKRTFRLAVAVQETNGPRVLVQEAAWQVIKAPSKNGFPWRWIWYHLRSWSGIWLLYCAERLRRLRGHE